MMGLISEKLFSILLDLIVGEVLKEIRAEINPQIEEINKRINLVESRVDKIQLLHLHTGLCSFRDDKLNDALKEFEYAERVDDMGAAARFWLSLVLYKCGKKEEAIGKLKDALDINPFIVPLEFMNNALVKDLSMQTFSNGIPAKWKRTFEDPSILSTVPAQETWGRWLLDGFESFASSNPDQTLIDAISTSGGDPVLQWDVAHGNTPHTFSLFTKLYLSSGNVRWTKRFRNFQLLFATPRYIVLESTGTPKRFEILNMESGRIVQQLSRTYFETAFFPDYSRREAIPGYLRSNHVLLDSRTELINTGSMYNRMQRTSLYDPFGIGIFRVDAYNFEGTFESATMHTRTTSNIGKAIVERVE